MLVKKVKKVKKKLMIEVQFKLKKWKFKEMNRTYTSVTKIRLIKDCLRDELGLVENVKLFKQDDEEKELKDEEEISSFCKDNEQKVTLIFDYDTPSHHSAPILNKPQRET